MVRYAKHVGMPWYRELYRLLKPWGVVPPNRISQISLLQQRHPHDHLVLRFFTHPFPNFRFAMAVLTDTFTTTVLYILVTLSFLMIVIRMVLSWRVNRRCTTEDAWMLCALCFLSGLWFTGRWIKYETNNVANPQRLTPEQVRRRVVGSKTVLVARFCYASAYVALSQWLLSLTGW